MSFYGRWFGKVGFLQASLLSLDDSREKSLTKFCALEFLACFELTIQILLKPVMDGGSSHLGHCDTETCFDTSAGQALQIMSVCSYFNSWINRRVSLAYLHIFYGVMLVLLALLQSQISAEKSSLNISYDYKHHTVVNEYIYFT